MNTATLYIRQAAVLLGIGLCACLPVAAHAQEPIPPIHLSLDEQNDATDDALVPLSLRGGRSIERKPSMEFVLRHLGREWPRLLTRYVQPVVRGLVNDQSRGHSLAFGSTLYRNRRNGLQLDGGIGRNFWGEREARLQIGMRF